MLLGFCLGFLTYALLCVCTEEDHIKAGALHLDRKVAIFLIANIFVVPMESLLLSHAQLHRHIYCHTDLHLAVENPFVPNDSWALFSLKITQMFQKVLP